MKQINITATGVTGTAFEVSSSAERIVLLVTDSWDGATNGAFGGTTVTLEVEAPDGKWLEYPGISFTSSNSAEVPLIRGSAAATTNYRFRATGGTGINLQAVLSAY